MPKDRSDPNDPLELVGVAVPASSEALDEMGRAFAEEFLRMGYAPKELLGLFQNPFYRGPSQVYRLRGEEAVAAIIAEAARQWGRRVDLRSIAGVTIGVARAGVSPAEEVAR